MRVLRKAALALWMLGICLIVGGAVGLLGELGSSILRDVVTVEVAQVYTQEFPMLAFPGERSPVQSRILVHGGLVAIASGAALVAAAALTTRLVGAAGE
jgi:hypothetical protein